MKKILILTFSLLMLCATSFADNWQWVKSTDTLTISVNKEQIYKNNNVYTGWAQMIAAEYARKTYNGQTIAKAIIKCSFTTISTGDMINILAQRCYDERGNLIYSDNTSNGWEPITPGTGGDAMYQKIRELYDSKHPSNN